MPPEATYSFIVICEADADRRIGCALADRVLCDEIDWLDEESLQLLRAWRGLQPGDPYLRWQSIPKLARERNIKAHGRFGGGAHRVVRQGLFLVKQLAPTSAAVVFVVDTEAQELSRRGLLAARDEARAEAGRASWPFAVVVGVADPKREAWVLAGFEARNPDENERLEIERRALGVDPCLDAAGLTASHGHAKQGTRRDAKLVLHALLAGDREREEACWRETSLDVLRARGAATGLRDFLDDVRVRLAPIFR